MTSVLSNTFWLVDPSVFLIHLYHLGFIIPLLFQHSAHHLASQLCRVYDFTYFNKKGFKGRITDQNLIRDKGRDDLISAVAQHQIKIANVE